MFEFERYSFSICIYDREHRPAISITLMVKIRQVAPLYEIKLLNLVRLDIFSTH